ncbi:hypothetical protein GUJ93_ZPchr0010g8475 [Zizania palustris]|uniref:Uncharacterized protein n=1 Tax=Zizania palustris TaxID=103762 RepID=A0A8J5WAQ0_ZIZPA|nr:hypothetical protein GUJ93_ZPchr0010g8475 [Zizania palustris]
MFSSIWLLLYQSWLYKHGILVNWSFILVLNIWRMHMTRSENCVSLVGEEAALSRAVGFELELPPLVSLGRLNWRWPPSKNIDCTGAESSQRGAPE